MMEIWKIYEMISTSCCAAYQSTCDGWRTTPVAGTSHADVVMACFENVAKVQICGSSLHPAGCDVCIRASVWTYLMHLLCGAGICIPV